MNSTDARVVLKLVVTQASNGEESKKGAQISSTEKRLVISKENEETFDSAYCGEPGSKLMQAKESVQEPHVEKKDLSLIEMLDLCDQSHSARFLGQWGTTEVDEETFASALYGEQGAISLRR